MEEIELVTGHPFGRFKDAQDVERQYEFWILSQN